MLDLPSAEETADKIKRAVRGDNTTVYDWEDLKVEVELIPSAARRILWYYRELLRESGEYSNKLIYRHTLLLMDIMSDLGLRLRESHDYYYLIFSRTDKVVAEVRKETI